MYNLNTDTKLESIKEKLTEDGVDEGTPVV